MTGRSIWAVRLAMEIRRILKRDAWVRFDAREGSARGLYVFARRKANRLWRAYKIVMASRPRLDRPGRRKKNPPRITARGPSG